MKFMVVKQIIFADNTIVDPNDIIHKLIPNFWGFLVQLLAFIILAILVIKFAYKPVNKYITARQNFMESELKSAKEKEEMASNNLQISKQELNATRANANNIIEKAKQDAMKEKESILASTNEEIAMKHKLLEEEIILEKKQAEEEIQKGIVDVALLASEKVLEREINDEDHRRLVNDFIKELK